MAIYPIIVCSWDVGVLQLLIFADSGGGLRVQKGPKYTVVILEQPLICKLTFLSLQLPFVNMFSFKLSFYIFKVYKYLDVLQNAFLRIQIKI